MSPIDVTLTIERLPPLGSAAYRSLLDRSVIDPEVRAAAAEVVNDVRDRGDPAVHEWTERFDGVRLKTSRVPGEDVAAAAARLDPTLRHALEEAIRRVELVHRAQLHTEARVRPSAGLEVWREWRPYDRVGLYVPGGRARYPSSVVMLAVPARLAGCPQVVLCSPPQGDGRVADAVLAAAALAGVTEVHAVGGAQAIAAMAYGTEHLPRVDKVFGPGNAYVTAAKLLVIGTVAIDMPAGPSELVIVSDGSAPAGWIAADLRAQAEHAPDALSVLISTDESSAREVAEMLGNVGTQIRFFLSDTLEAAVRFANDFAPEHLALACQRAERYLSSVARVGSVFLGASTPPAAGDYATGANHVLPTGGTARSFGPLGVEAFGRMVQVQTATIEAAAALTRVVAPIAEVEGLRAHRRSVELRGDTEAAR